MRALCDTACPPAHARPSTGRAHHWRVTQHTPPCPNTRRAAAPAGHDGATPPSPTSTPAATPAAAPTPPFFWAPITVRDSELDAYGVVNNAVYSTYLEHARHEWLAAVGLETADAAADAGGALALADMTIRFHAPLLSGDVCRVGVRLSKATPARLVVDQRIELVERRRVRGGKGVGAPPDPGLVVVTAAATVVSLDGEYRPRRIPPGIASALAGWQEGKPGGALLSWGGE